MTDHTIKKLEKALDEVAFECRLSLTDKKDVIKAVEKGIKKELIFKDKIGKYHSIFVCPNCKKNKWITNVEYEYPLRCSHCGQRLSWKEFRATARREDNLLKLAVEESK